MPYNPNHPLDFDTNHCSLSEYCSHEHTYETQNPLGNTKPRAFTEAVRATTAHEAQGNGSGVDGVSGGGGADTTGTGQLSLF